MSEPGEMRPSKDIGSGLKSSRAEIMGKKMEARVGIEPAYTELQDELSVPIFSFKYMHLKHLPDK